MFNAINKKMKKISDKNKSLILFLLAIILIIGAWYFYKSFDIGFCFY